MGVHYVNLIQKIKLDYQGDQLKYLKKKNPKKFYRIFRKRKGNIIMDQTCQNFTITLRNSLRPNKLPVHAPMTRESRPVKRSFPHTKYYRGSNSSYQTPEKGKWGG